MPDFFPEAASKGAAREHWRRRRKRKRKRRRRGRRRWMRRRRMRGRRGSRRRGRRRIGRLEAAAPPPQSSPSLPVERRISRSCTNPQNPQKTAHLINPEFPHLLVPENPHHLLHLLDNTAISNPKDKLEQNQVIHETRLPEVVTPHKYTN